MGALLLGSLAWGGTAYAAPNAATGISSVQQEGACTGVVKDATGVTVIGASVLVKGTTNGVITDIDGNFRLNNVKPGDIIQISYIGYVTQEIKWEGKPLNIIMREDTELLDEVVVVGYATVKKANLTGAVSAVDSEVLEERPITNLGQGLQGTIPNLIITTNPQPGSGSSFNVRGTTSLNGGSPLVLVDGVEMDPNLINPQDVASVSVLKDAASASIYGARAAYGVVLITTKGGKKNQPTRVSFDASVSFNSPTTRPSYMDSMEYATWMNTANMNTTLLISGYFFRFFIPLMCGRYISPSGLDHVRSVYLIPRPILHGRYISPRVPDPASQYILPRIVGCQIFRSFLLTLHPAPHFLHASRLTISTLASLYLCIPHLTLSAPRVSLARHLRSLIPPPLRRRSCEHKIIYFFIL